MPQSSRNPAVDKTLHVIVRTLCIVLAASPQSFPFTRFANFSSLITVNEIALLGDRACVASTGGLYLLDISTRQGELLSDSRRFPDLKLTSVSIDTDGNVWAGSKRGYLHRMTQQGHVTTYDAYSSAGWGIRVVYPYGGFILVGSTNGFSVFDPRKGTALTNATRLGSLKSPVVNTVFVRNEVLYLGCEGGVAMLNMAGKRIESLNFYDHQIWAVQESDEPIVDFVVHNAVVHPMTAPAALVGSTLMHADSNIIMVDADSVVELPSKIISMSVRNDTVWIGTEYDYFYRWKAGAEIRQFKIVGMTFKSVNRVVADGLGNVWMLSKISSGQQVWWQGIGFTNGTHYWRVYNHFWTGQIGLMGDSEDFHGACLTREGDFWAGTPGKGVKVFDRTDSEWRRYNVGARECFAGFVRDTGDIYTQAWSKCDAIAQDSLGFLWIASWENCSGSLICYDPSFASPVDSNFHRYFPKEPVRSPYYMDNIRCLNVDVYGSVFMGSEDGHLVIFSHDSTALDGTISITKSITNLVTMLDMYSTDNGYTWVVTGKGLYRYNPSDESFEPEEDVPKNVTCVEAEGDDYLWLGTSSDGLVRYDWHTGDKAYYDRTHGLMSNTIVDLSIDMNNGYLWLATAEGLSRFDLGHTDEVITGNGNMEISPNPFSFSDPSHAVVVISNLAPQTSVSIYDPRGKFIDEPIAASQNRYEWIFNWSPARDLVPGTYFCTARVSGRASVGKVLLIP